MAVETALPTNADVLAWQPDLPLHVAEQRLSLLVNSWDTQDVQTAAPSASVQPTRDITYPPVTRTITPPRQPDSHPTIFSLTDDSPAQPTRDHWSYRHPWVQDGDLTIAVGLLLGRRAYIAVAPRHHTEGKEEGQVVTRGELEALRQTISAMPIWRRGGYVREHQRIVIGAPEQPSQRITSRLAQTMRGQLSRVPRIQLPKIPRSKAEYPKDLYAALRQDPSYAISQPEARQVSPQPFPRQRRFPY